jgi:cell division protein FtsL
MSRRSAAVRRTRGTTPLPPVEGTRPGLTLNERLVRESDRERAGELLRVLTLGIAVLVPLLLHVWQQVVFVETAYRIEELRTDRSAMERELRSLKLERASLESLQRIEAQARAQGLVVPPVASVISVQPAAQDARGGVRGRP